MKSKLLLLSFLLMTTITSSFAQKGKTKNVILISIDGYRWQEIFKGADSSLLFPRKYRKQDSAELVKKYWAATPKERREKLMPFFWSTIAKQGQLYGNRDLKNYVNVKNKYWFSYPGRSETLCGYFDPAINSNSYPDNPNENVLEFINKQKGYQNKVVTFAGWDAVAQIVNRNRNKMPLYNPYEDVKDAKLTEAQKLANEMQYLLPDYFGKSVRFDLSTYAMAKTYIAANHPKLVYIDFVDPDDFGHSGEYDSFLDAGHYLDKMIASLWASLQADPFYKDNTTIMICPDHGRGTEKGWVSHGSGTTHSNETWFAVIGPDTPAKGEMNTEGQIYQDQFAQTLAYFLGFKFTTNHPVGERVESAMSLK
ncbi:alkaline phosphatase family protein [Pedobacter foliorum]|uniref:alkaline phosphatase family protein n=1 Tax=Pedobacter foliorum TaxID=2739058 RepID=UPI00156614E4|nr:alkaline phosphatase family protein [Pedobacter foliorum]NRF40813.1 alkaline phosphatase family protein [Pedobacter foliorum]